MAEYYSVELAEKTLRGMTENALACIVNGTVPLGYATTEDNLSSNLKMGNECIDTGYFNDRTCIS